MKYVFDKQLEMINDWCMVKNVQRFNQLSQIIYIDKSIGDGYFERYDFGSIGLSRVNRPLAKVINQARNSQQRRIASF